MYSAINTEDYEPTSGRSHSIPTIIYVVLISILILYSIVSTGLWVFMLEHNDLSTILEAIARNLIQ